MNSEVKKKKCSETQVGRIVIHLGDEEKRIYEKDFPSYLENGWERGFSDKHKRKSSDAQIGRTAPNKGVPCSEETKKKISASLLGNVPWNYGLTKEDDKRIQHISEAQSVTKIAKYGNAWGYNNMNEEHKEKISQKLMGNTNGCSYKKDPEKLKIKLTKDYITRKLHNSFNTSSTESKLYEQLLEENKTKSIYRNYKDLERYPFYCDFYIKEDDLFIELNAHWTHGGKPYDPTDIECQNQLMEWEEKAKTSQFYKNAIETWTIRDVKKLQCAKDHNLNYKVIY